MIPDDQVDEVRARADLVAIIGELVPLKKAGREYKANCPFHEEKTPSFCVVPDKGFYKCFGCGESGDVFAFVMKRLGLEFVEAVRYVAARAGVELREVRRDRPDEDPLRPLYEANAFAAAWFRERLLDPGPGRTARAYLESRGIGAETAERFGLGYAPDDWRALREAAAKHEIDDEILLQVGLLIDRDKPGEPYDRFRNRIIFPIEALGGRIVAFGGRTLGAGGEGQPKYLNSPETPLYQKGRVLYGLHWARHAIRREGAALVVEGYMDLVSLAAGGFEHVVATLGTALTEEHARLLGRYTSHVVLLFDSDPAGLRATFKAGDILLSAGLQPAVVTLPPGEDPDTLVQREGPEALRSHVDQAVDVLDRKLQILDQKDYFSSIERTRDAVDRLLPTLRAATDPALRDIYVARVAERTGVQRSTLESELRRLARAGSASRGDRSPTQRGPVPRSEPLGPAPRLGPELRLLQVLARDRERRNERLETVLRRIGPGDFSDPAFRAIFQAFLDDPDLDGPPEGMAPEVARRMEVLLAKPTDETELVHAGRTFAESLDALQRSTLEHKAYELDRQIELAEDEAAKRELASEKARLSQELREMGHGWAHTVRKLRKEPPTPSY